MDPRYVEPRDLAERSTLAAFCAAEDSILGIVLKVTTMLHAWSSLLWRGDAKFCWQEWQLPISTLSWEEEGSRGREGEGPVEDAKWTLLQASSCNMQLYETFQDTEFNKQAAKSCKEPWPA